jgi:hypothetical protein
VGGEGVGADVWRLYQSQITLTALPTTTPTPIIEAALKKTIDNLDQYPQLKAIKCNLSYNDDGSMMTAKGERTFFIQGRE